MSPLRSGEVEKRRCTTDGRELGIVAGAHFPGSPPWRRSPPLPRRGPHRQRRRRRPRLQHPTPTLAPQPAAPRRWSRRPMMLARRSWRCRRRAGPSRPRRRRMTRRAATRWASSPACAARAPRRSWRRALPSPRQRRRRSPMTSRRGGGCRSPPRVWPTRPPRWPRQWRRTGPSRPSRSTRTRCDVPTP